MQIEAAVEIQKAYSKLTSGQVPFTKKNMCAILVPLRDKYGLTDRQVLAVARNELSLEEIMLLSQTQEETNPRRIPRTQADVDKAYSNGILEGLNRGIDLMLYVVIDKHDAPMDDVQQLAGELNHAAQCVAEGYITWADIRQMLKEYGVETALE
jgi:hypothetical protein